MRRRKERRKIWRRGSKGETEEGKEERGRVCGPTLYSLAETLGPTCSDLATRPPVT